MRSGWVLVRNTWHYFRGARTLCGMRVRQGDITATLALKLREMTPHDANCPRCQAKRLNETGANLNG